MCTLSLRAQDTESLYVCQATFFAITKFTDFELKKRGKEMANSATLINS